MGKKFDPSELLKLPLMANVATLAADGSPRNAPMWFIWEDASIWLLGSTESRSCDRLLQDPRCAIEIVDFQNEAGVLLHLGLRGRATVEENSVSRFKRLLAKYLGDEKSWNPWFIENIAMIDSPTSRFIKMKPDSFFTNNVSYFRSGPDLVWPSRQSWFDD